MNRRDHKENRSQKTGLGLSLAVLIGALAYRAKASIMAFAGCGAAIVTFFIGSMLPT